MKINQKLKRILAVVLAIGVVGGCALDDSTIQSLESLLAEEMTAVSDVESETANDTGDDLASLLMDLLGEDADFKLETTEYQNEFYAGKRPMLISMVAESGTADIKPNVAPYTAAPNLGNVANLWQFDELQQGGGLVDKLAKNGFVVSSYGGSEFFEIYESNRYQLVPNFVTVDSLMHTYHLYFAHLLKNIEKKYLYDNVLTLSQKMMENSLSQYEQLKGSEWESAALRNVAFFTVGAKLLDDGTAVNADVSEVVTYELNNINSAIGIADTKITDALEDYTQYIPRGYYEGDARLERYFKAMMWYGRIHFRQENEDLDRSAFLMTKALGDDAQAYALWQSTYAVTAFFVGASDDLFVSEYAPVILGTYGETIAVSELAGTEDKFEIFHKMTSRLRPPEINSVPIMDGEDNTILGLRFMGQRFTIDAAVMQNLIYQRVGENSRGERRMLPDVLDVAAALGSDAALDISNENGAGDFPGYSQNMEKIRNYLSQENPQLWSASLYSGWVNTLRPLLDVKGEGYPMFMQNREWQKKDIECFAGSYAELKHDTILYAKQVIAEMGDGGEEDEHEPPDDRGYVEPEPLVYERFAVLSEQTAAGLRKFGLLEGQDEENLTLLSQMAKKLLTISEKELRGELPTEEEFEFIKTYGGNIEHFWLQVAKDSLGMEYVSTDEFPAAIVADIATNSDAGTVLEVATGDPSKIYVVVNVDGKIKVATGSAYSFYQFEWPSNDRLTDTKWRVMMGFEAGSDGYYNYSSDGLPVERPGWTESYRYRYEWE